MRRVPLCELLQPAPQVCGACPFANFLQPAPQVCGAGALMDSLDFLQAFLMPAAGRPQPLELALPMVPAQPRQLGVVPAVPTVPTLLADPPPAMVDKSSASRLCTSPGIAGNTT